jgi:hypothetical protein
MHGYSHGAFILRQHLVHQAHGGRQGDGRPGDKEHCADYHRLPGRDHDHQAEAGHGHQVEKQQGLFGADAVGEVASRKTVEGREEVVHGLQQSDGQRAAPQGHQVDRQKTFGHPLAHAHQHHHGQQADGAALQGEKAGDP